MKNKLASLINIWNSISKRNKILIITMLVMLLVVVPLTIIQSLTQQETRQRAGGGNPLILTASSTKSSYNIDEEFNTNIALENPDRKDVSAVDFTVTYDSDTLSLIEFDTEGAYFFPIVKDTQTLGSTHLVGIQMSTLNDTFLKAPALLRIGSITFKVIKKTTGNIEISFKDSMITASQQPDEIKPNTTPQILSINADFKNPWETPAPTPTTRPSSPAGSCSATNISKESRPSCNITNFEASPGCKIIGFGSLDDCAGNQSGLCYSTGDSEPSNCAIASPL